MKVLIDIPVKYTRDQIIVGKLAFQRCDNCPLSDEEIVIYLLAELMSRIGANDFTIVEEE